MSLDSETVMAYMLTVACCYIGEKDCSEENATVIDKLEVVRREMVLCNYG